MNWFGVQSPDVPRWQALAEPFIQRALERSNGDYAAEDIFAACSRGDMQLWMVYDGNKITAAVVTTITETRRQKRCVVCYAGGERMEEWVPFMAGVEAWAKEQGCASVDVTGRKGWERVLDGFHCHSVTLRKFL